MQTWIQPPACSDHGWHRIMSSYWLSHFYLMKNTPNCWSILVLIVGCLTSLLTSHNPKNNWCLSRIFGARFGGKNRSLSTCKLWSKQIRSWAQFLLIWLISFSRHIQWNPSKADPICPDGTFKEIIDELLFNCIKKFLCPFCFYSFFLTMWKRIIRLLSLWTPTRPYLSLLS